MGLIKGINQCLLLEPMAKVPEPRNSITQDPLANNVFLGRQPIFGREREIRAYELLYRTETADLDATGSVQTSRVLIHSLINIGLDSIVGQYPAFINATEPLLLGHEIELFPSDRVVFEILETVEPSAVLAERIGYLRQRGLRFAVDDFVYDPRWDPILEQVQFVKLDVLASPVESEAQLKPLRHPGVQLLAEKIETYEAFQRYLDLGFDLFQGYFFCRPETLSGRAPDANKLSVIRVLGALSDPDTSNTQLAALISQDATLCFQLLRLSNSAAMQRHRAVETIEDAVVRVGTDNIRHWVSLLLLTHTKTRKPHELLFTAMTRARMCEVLAQGEGSKNPGASFVAGLLSIADALLDRPFAELIASMPLTDQLREGLLEHQNDIGKRLKQVLDYERMLASGGTVRADRLQVNRLRTVYFEALRWTQQLESRMGEV